MIHNAKFIYKGVNVSMEISFKWEKNLKMS